MIVENSETLQKWLRGNGYDALAELPSFDVPEEEYEKHLAEIRSQGLHADEGSNQARAIYRCLTSHLGPAEKRPAAQDSMAAHLDRAARVFNQSVAVLAGKTEAHEKIIDAARREILQATAADAGAALQFMVKFYDRTEQQFHLQRSGIETLIAVNHATQHLIERAERRFKFSVAIILFLLAALLLLAIPKAHGQDKSSAPAKPPISLSAPSSGKVVVLDATHDSTVVSLTSLNVPDSYKLRIRDVQYSKDKVLIRLQNLQLQVQKAEQEAQAKDKTINEIVYQLATENHVDLSKWVLDLDVLAWQPKEK